MKSPKISDLLGKINKAVENPAFPAVSKLEQDLLMQHIRDLYEEIDAAFLTPKDQTGVSASVKKETIIEPTVTIKRPAIRPNEDLLMKEEKIVVTKPEVKVETKTEKVEKKVENAVQSGSSSINESIKSSGSLNEKLKTTSAAEVHKKLATKPLKELIDLNKRFVLLNELFKGNTEAYTKAIAHIDTLPDFETAQTFIASQLASNYYWDESKQSTRMFSKLVRMKFGIE